MEEKFFMDSAAKEKMKKDKKKHIFFTILCSIISLALGISITSLVLKDDKSYDSNDATLKKFNEVYDIIKNEWYFGEVAEDESVYVDRALDAMINEQNTDAYLKYNRIPESTNNVTYGLGIVIRNYDGYVIINRVYASSPAYNAGLKAGDVITHVDGIDIRYMALSEISSLTKGDYKTEVNITYIRDGVSKQVSVIRNVWTEDSVSSFDYGTTAMIKITGFNDDTAIAVDKELAELTSSSRTYKVKNLIFDLRDNPGGYVMAFTQLTDLFVKKGTKLGRYVFKNDKDSYDVTASSGVKYEFDSIIILVNGDSASASESFTASMKDNLSNVTVVGETTYGKGIAQKTISFQDGSSLKYTYAEYIRPNGSKLHQIGVTPDILIAEKGYHRVYEEALEKYDTYEECYIEYLKAMGFTGSDLEVIKSYQNARGISVTGEFDDATLGKIYKDLYDQEIQGMNDQLQAVLKMYK